MAADSFGTKNQPHFAGSGVPADAADMTLIADFAANVGNRKAGTDSARGLLTGADLWDGLAYYCTDTQKSWLYVLGTGWVLMFQVPTAWTNLTLTSGWTATGGVWASPAYRINQLGEIEMRGEMTPRTGYTTSEVFATLPTGARPAQQIAFPWVNNSTGTPAMAEAVITSAGAMTLTPAGIGAVNFGYIHFATV